MVWCMQGWLFPSSPLFPSFSDHLVVNYFMVCVATWIKHGRINLPSLLNLRTTLLMVYYFTSLMTYIVYGLTTFYVTWEPLFGQKNSLFKDSEVSSVVIYLIWVLGCHCDFCHLEWGLVQTFGSICCICFISADIFHDW